MSVEFTRFKIYTYRQAFWKPSPTNTICRPADTMTEPAEPDLGEQTQETIDFTTELAQWLQPRLTLESAPPIAFALIHIALSILSLEVGPGNAVGLVQKSIKRWHATVAATGNR